MAGGLERIAKLLSENFIKKGDEVTYCYLGQIAGSLSYFHRCVLEFFLKLERNHRIPLKKSIFNIRIFFNLCWNLEKFDIIHINGDNGSLASNIKRYNTIMTWHGITQISWSKLHPRIKFLSWLHPSAFFELNASINSPSVTIVNSSLFDFVSRASKREDITLINNGIDIETFKPNQIIFDASKINSTVLRLRCLWVATSDSKRKGLKIAKDAVKSIDSVELFIVGADGIDSNNVHYLGKVSEEQLLLNYQHSDVFLFPSSSEGQSIALLEAIACGCIPIIFRQIAISGMVDGINCLLCDTPLDFEFKLKYLIENPELVVNQLKKNARALSLNYSLENMFASYQDIFSKIMLP